MGTSKQENKIGDIESGLARSISPGGSPGETPSGFAAGGGGSSPCEDAQRDPPLLWKQKIRDVPDFPKPGIVFKDITPLLADVKSFQGVIDAFARRYADKAVDAIVAVESRGFIFGSVLAYRLDAAFVPARKKGKLPYKTESVEYALEYGTDQIEIHRDAIHEGHRILVIDDVLATGGTAKATCDLVEKLNGKVIECAFVIELGFLNGREKLKGREIFSLIQY